MSLKAKLEAVVYAAEEPVTLAQLAAIFADEVLPASEEVAGPAQPETAQIELNGLGVTSEIPAEETEAVSPAPEQTPAGEDAGSAESGEAAEKKLARQRDRKVRQELQKVLEELIADYGNSDRGMEIREIAGGYRMATKPEYHDAVRSFVKSLKPPMKLSLQALETLAVIAYKQPVTAPEVSEIRGVDSGGVLGSLVSRKLITTAGRKPVIGRPILYKTTKEFLLRFGLKDVSDLPSMEEFEKMAGELAESEAEGERQETTIETSDQLPPAEAASAEEASSEPQIETETEPSTESPAEPEAEPHA
ncbi:MAG TPA: SMC-Scp complex subunit ScpB [Acidobacteriaceae bacterium]|nr:SMC-Scp complex subunit ScpB [Acidobacteriaceae bacterium]